MKYSTCKICNNYKDLVPYINDIRNYNNQLAFRGLADFNYTLQTRIADKFKTPDTTNKVFADILNVLQKYIENTSIKSLFSVDSFNFPTKNFKNLWEYIFQAQHIGIPTIAMDWSLELETALYFACNNESIVGKLWILNTEAFNWNHDTIVSKSLYCQNPFDLKDYYFIRPSFHDDSNYQTIIPAKRLYYQKGAFLIMPSNDNIEPLEIRRDFKHYLRPIIITTKFKKEFNNILKSKIDVSNSVLANNQFKEEPFIEKIDGKYYKQYNDKFFYGIIPPELLTVVNEIRLKHGFDELNN